MRIFKRLAIIFSTLAITSFASHEADKKPSLTKESAPLYYSGLKLYKEGCGDQVSEHLIVDAGKCIAAFSRLKQAVSLNQTLSEANRLIAELYYYRPAQMNWGRLDLKQDAHLKNLGLRHALKAVEYSPMDKKAKDLLNLYQTDRGLASESETL